MQDGRLFWVGGGQPEPYSAFSVLRMEGRTRRTAGSLPLGEGGAKRRMRVEIARSAENTDSDLLRAALRAVARWMPLRRRCHTSDVGHWFAMTREKRTRNARPYDAFLSLQMEGGGAEKKTYRHFLPVADFTATFLFLGAKGEGE